MTEITHFAAQFGITFTRPIREIKQRFFLDFQGDFLYGGVFLGEKKKKQFIPSLQFLELLSSQTSRTITLSSQEAWLFTCGRDIFTIDTDVSPGLCIIVDQFSDVIGYGMVQTGNVQLKNYWDVGMMLRREMSRSKR